MFLSAIDVVVVVVVVVLVQVATRIDGAPTGSNSDAAYTVFTQVEEDRVTKKPEANNDYQMYRLALITDMDKYSAIKGQKHKYSSFMRTGIMMLNADWTRVGFIWNPNDTMLTGGYAYGGRGAEFSELASFDHQLLTVDDHTGIVYHVQKDNALVPWVILAGGAGNITKPFKGEWMTVKNGSLWVGGHGNEWRKKDGSVDNTHNMWVKQIDNEGRVQHINWYATYDKVRNAAGIHFPGYLSHEAVQWSDVHQRWFFLPRKASNIGFAETVDEHSGTNLLISFDESFEQSTVVRIGEDNAPSWKGFSAFSFVPGTKDNLIVALKSEETADRPLESYITVFNIAGHVILPDRRLSGAYKFEGLNFLQ